jgi:hypothetical protein
MHYETRPMYGLMTAGLIIFGASWSINAVAAYLADDGQLAIPVAGPILEAIDYDKHHPYADSRVVVAGLAFDALVQGAGVIMALTGMIVKHKVKVYDGPRVSVVPTASAAGAGLAAVGMF